MDRKLDKLTRVPLDGPKKRGYTSDPRPPKTPATTTSPPSEPAKKSSEGM
jgi:hypothetical protein